MVRARTSDWEKSTSRTRIRRGEPSTAGDRGGSEGPRLRRSGSASSGYASTARSPTRRSPTGSAPTRRPSCITSGHWSTPASSPRSHPGEEPAARGRSRTSPPASRGTSTSDDSAADRNGLMDAFLQEVRAGRRTRDRSSPPPRSAPRPGRVRRTATPLGWRYSRSTLDRPPTRPASRTRSSSSPRRRDDPPPPRSIAAPGQRPRLATRECRAPPSGPSATGAAARPAAARRTASGLPRSHPTRARGRRRARSPAGTRPGVATRVRLRRKRVSPAPISTPSRANTTPATGSIAANHGHASIASRVHLRIRA